MERAFTTALALVAVASIAGCSDVVGGSEDGKVSVVAALYPLGFVAQRVGGAGATVTDLTPAGAEPHDLELTAGQVVTLTDADLTLYLGSGFQPAVEDAVAELDDKHKLDALAEVPTIETDGQRDPHVWLSPPLLADIGDSVASRLGEIDPSGASDYKRNAQRLRSALEALDQHFAGSLAGCDKHDILVSHEAFGYLADRYDLKQIGVAGVDPEAEPSPTRLAELERLIRERAITTVFYEKLGSPAVADTVAREAGVATAPLDPIESRPAEGDYLTAMRSDLEELSDALDC